MMGRYGKGDGNRMRELNAQAKAHRDKLYTLVDLSRERLRPQTLMHQAGNRALDLVLDGMGKAKSAVRAHPAKALAAAAGIGALLARRPLFKAAAAGFAAGREHWRARSQAKAATRRKED